MGEMLVKRLRKIALLMRVVQAQSNIRRHRWTDEEIKLILQKYHEWSIRTGPEGLFDLKSFVLSLRSEFPFFDTLSDKQFYERVKRLLYRALGKFGVAWKHKGKKALLESVSDPKIVNILKVLEEEGVFITVDGEVLITFVLKSVTGEDDGYWIPDVIKALKHLQQISANVSRGFEENAIHAKRVIPLLQHFLDLWNDLENKEQYYKAPEHKQLEGYQLSFDKTNPKNVQVVKPDGTAYVVNRENHTCTCPAGQAGRTCKHLTYVLLNLSKIQQQP